MGFQPSSIYLTAHWIAIGGDSEIVDGLDVRSSDVAVNHIVRGLFHINQLSHSLQSTYLGLLPVWVHNVREKPQTPSPTVVTFLGRDPLAAHSVERHSQIS